MRIELVPSNSVVNRISHFAADCFHVIDFQFCVHCRNMHIQIISVKIKEILPGFTIGGDAHE